MKKPACYLLICCLLAVSVCLLATAAGLNTLGLGWDYWRYETPLVGGHVAVAFSDDTHTSLAFDGKAVFRVPATNVGLTALGLVGLALPLLVIAGIVAGPLFHRTGREAGAADAAGPG